MTLAIVGRFSKFFHIWTHQEICNKTLSCFPPHITYVATLPCETKMPLLSFYHYRNEESAVNLTADSTFVPSVVLVC